MWPASTDEQMDSNPNDSEEYTPQVKKQKQKKQPWTEENMLEALNCCRNQEIGVDEASLIYGIPKRSLRLKLRENNVTAIDEKYRVFVLQIFPQQAEYELVEYLQEMLQSQYTLTSTDVRRFAYELASEKYQLGDLPREENCLLGNRWYKSFAAKYPHLDVDDSDTVPCQSSSERFFDSLENSIRKYNLDARRIYSVDGIELKFRASHAYDFDKIYHRRKIIYTDAKAICCFSASGVCIPPLFVQPEGKGSKKLLGHTIFSENETEPCSDEDAGHVKTFGKAYDKLKYFSEGDSRILPSAEEVASIKTQIKAHLNKKHQPITEEKEEELREELYEQFSQLRNKVVAKNDSNLNVITNEVFHEWFKSFLAYVKPHCHERVLLLLGDQSYVKSLKTMELAKANGVHFLVLPPHSIHKIYPLDGFTMSLNRNLSTSASFWIGKNPEFKIQEVPLQELFKKSYRNTANPTIAKNGFIYSGIWPVNRSIFDSSELGGESVLLKNRSQPCVPPHTNGSSAGVFVMDRTRTIDISKLCRVCMNEKMYMKPLFDSSGANYYGKKISEIVGRLISPDDGLPHRICQYCLVQLIDTVKIKNVAAESQSKMRENVQGLFYDNGLRICMGEKPLMTSIFYSNHTVIRSEPDLKTKIIEVTNCQVGMQDGLSQSICAFCRSSINQAWEFVRKVKSSDKRFREILAEKQNQIL